MGDVPGISHALGNCFEVFDLKTNVVQATVVQTLFRPRHTSIVKIQDSQVHVPVAEKIARRGRAIQLGDLL
jgi:hypothetical protein